MKISGFLKVKGDTMRWFYFIILPCLLVLIVAGVIYIHKGQVILVKNPPESLAKWYKPENERQVWLHNMFKLRREMQAARFYLERKDEKHLGKWVDRLKGHYLKIGEMVPEWRKQLNIEAVSNIEESAKTGDYKELSKALDDLSKSCEACHRDYRAVTALKYRAPDFSFLKINEATSFNAHMKKLTNEVNSIKIASEDGMKNMALLSLAELKTDIKLLGEICINCHKKTEKVYPGDVITKTINSLEQSLKAGTIKDQGRYLGTLAVLACARCHGTHRLAYDARKMLWDEQGWLELVKH